MNRRFAFAAVALLFVSLQLTASAENPPAVPPASTESLRALERAGAYRYQMLLTDANGDKVMALNGAAKKGKALAMVASSADDQPGFSSKVRAAEQKDGKLELHIDFSERTSVTAIADGQTIWTSSGFHFVDHNYELGKSRVVTLADWKTSRPGPLRMEITVQPFVADAD